MNDGRRTVLRTALGVFAAALLPSAPQIGVASPVQANRFDFVVESEHALYDDDTDTMFVEHIIRLQDGRVVRAACAIDAHLWRSGRGQQIAREEMRRAVRLHVRGVA